MARAYEYFQNREPECGDLANCVCLRSHGTYTNPRFDNNRFGGQFGGTDCEE